jgi:hemerythrin-like metal-binding protein
MVLIEWKQEFAVGVPEVDYEHRELIALINELAATLERQDSELGVEEFLGEIFARISAHFALEEKIMRERRYDQYEDHKADHERLLDDIRDIMDEYEDEQRFDREALAGRLSAWFGVHFRTKDARLHRHLPH